MPELWIWIKIFTWFEGNANDLNLYFMSDVEAALMFFYGSFSLWWQTPVAWIWLFFFWWIYLSEYALWAFAEFVKWTNERTNGLTTPPI